MKWRLRVPATSANLGIGFDTVGLAFQFYLELDVNFAPSPSQATVELTYEGDSAQDVSCDPRLNLILQSTLHYFHRQRNGGQGPVHLPAYTDLSLLPLGHLRVHVCNPIPLSRGLGSSAAAITAGVLLGQILYAADNKASEELMSLEGKEKALNVILEIEGHPDNVTACLLGGLTVSYLRTDEERHRRKRDPATGSHALVERPLCEWSRYRLHPTLHCVCVVPAFELSTSKARQVLPQNYTRSDCVYSLQRLSLFLSRLCRPLHASATGNTISSETDSEPELDPWTVYEVLQDRLHQPYRQHLIPGFKKVLELTPQDIEGFVGCVLSGAGPTVLAFCSANMETVAERIQKIFKQQSVDSTSHVFELDETGATVQIVAES